MKTLLTLTSLSVALISSAAQPFLFPTNDPSQITLGWTASPSANVTNYYLYQGIGSMQYTNKIAVGTATTVTVTLPARGVTYFFNVTAKANGIESAFDGEVSFTPQVTQPPTMKPIVVLTVQAAPKASGMFADTGMNWPLLPDQPDQFYRVRLDKGFALSARTPPAPWSK